MDNHQPISKQDLKDLMAAGTAPCVSIYMPARSAGNEPQQNQIRIKNLLTEAENRLVEGWMRVPDAQDLLEGVRSQVMADGSFSQREQTGLAIFVCPDFVRVFRLLPAFAEQVVVGSRFHVRPLLPLLTGDGVFYVLAISLNEIRLLRGSRDSAAEIELERVPDGLEDALRYDVAEKQLQQRLAASEHSGGRPVIFHGHGGTRDASRSNLERYLHQVDDGLMKALRGERAPLVVAGVDYIRSAFTQISDYPNLMETGITGAPDIASTAELHAAAWEIVRPRFERAREEAAARYRELAQTDRTSSDIATIVPAAVHGGVESLFIADDQAVWGAYVPERNAVETHKAQRPDSEDLLDFAAVHTLLNSGVVYAGEDTPGGGAVCAVFRYEPAISSG